MIKAVVYAALILGALILAFVVLHVAFHIIFWVLANILWIGFGFAVGYLMRGAMEE